MSSSRGFINSRSDLMNTSGTAKAAPDRRVLRCAALLTAVLLWLPRTATAQTPEPAPQRLTLDDAVRRGLETSHRIAEAVARGEAADAVVGERRAATLPQIAGQAGYTRTNHVDTFGILLPNNQLRVIYPDVPDTYRTRLDLQWPVYTGGRLDALERAARIDATASADEIATARADLTLEITRAFWSLVTTTESRRVVQEAVTRIAAHLKDVRNQLAAGLVPPSDVFTVEAQESRQRMLAVQARVARDVAEADLTRLVGAAPGTALEPAGALDAFGTPEGAPYVFGTPEGAPYVAPAARKPLASLLD